MHSANLAQTQKLCTLDLRGVAISIRDMVQTAAQKAIQRAKKALENGKGNPRLELLTGIAYYHGVEIYLKSLKIFRN